MKVVAKVYMVILWSSSFLPFGIIAEGIKSGEFISSNA